MCAPGYAINNDTNIKWKSYSSSSGCDFPQFSKRGQGALFTVHLIFTVCWCWCRSNVSLQYGFSLCVNNLHIWTPVLLVHSSKLTVTCLLPVQGGAHKLAVDIIQNCAGKLEQTARIFLSTCISNKDAPVNEHRKLHHKIIVEIFQCAPKMLFAVIPSLTQELLVCHSLLTLLHFALIVPELVPSTSLEWPGWYPTGGSTPDWEASCLL
jgi:hypothetical protein